MKIDLNLLPLFLAVAGRDNFRAAADHLGVTRSAVSQGIRRLEDALEATLVTRTTRAVHLTEAGQQLLDLLSGPLGDIEAGLELIGGDAAPRGHLRIAVTSIAEPFLSGPLIAGFVRAYHEITLDVTVTDEEFDIVSRGFDAGVRLGEVIEQDMIAVALGGPQREVVAASPAYLARRGVPAHPRDLIDHRCIGWRRSPEEAPHRWEFEEDDTPFDVAVRPEVTSNDLHFMRAMALSGAGLTLAPEETLRPQIESGALVTVRDAYLPPFPSFFLYFPQRQNMAPKLRTLVDHVKLHGLGTGCRPGR